MTAPASLKNAAAVEQSIEYCCHLAKRAKTQFYVTFFALPKPMFRDMCVLYAFMRKTDDLADDLAASIDERAARLMAWRGALERALAGESVDDPILPATADLVGRSGIDPQWLVDVIDGVESDLTPRPLATFAELEDYCYHVAGAVGLSCIQIWKFTDDRAKPAAIACGTAFQLTNILRDVAEDFGQGRVYLPQEELDRFGVAPEQLARGGSDPAYQALMKFEADRARSYFRKAEPILEWLSPEGRRVQRAMFAMYGGLLDEIERRKFDVQSRRVSVSRLRKLWIAARCFWPG
jgi:phytoene synthase